MSIFPLLQAICRGGRRTLSRFNILDKQEIWETSLAMRRAKVSAKERPPPKGRWAEKA